MTGLSGFVGAGGEINLFAAFGAFVGFVEFIGKDFFGFIAFRTLTGE